MAASDTTSMALFCDFENVALGVRDAKYEKFDIKPVLERLLAKGSIVVKKAYCDWERYKAFKATMHEANFELIEIPHVRQSGKNSADIRMVVDALDLCYTKSHVDTFVIISGDSDFSPLVSKLRENAKQVIGVGVKQSTSDLLIANCDEFIFYDDLVREREAKRAASNRRDSKDAPPRRSPEEEKARREETEAKKAKAIELAAATFDDLIAVRGDVERIWASVLKEAIKRRNPGFNESYYGYKAFGTLLEDAAARGLIGVGRDEKSGTYVTRAAARVTPAEPVAAATAPAEAPAAEETPAAVEAAPAARGRGRGRGRKAAEPAVGGEAAAAEAVAAPAPAADSVAAPEALAAKAGGKASGKAGGKGSRRGKSSATPAVDEAASVAAVAAPVEAAVPTLADEAGKAAGAKKAPARGGRRPRKAKEGGESA
ncbi:NYN domain-containing protein [Azospira restricta]|uniref:NYN domain-containing protein n=1 Tax=Azospira restricta TaxID=404405 RepID=A0A974PYT0_9RHOO|nr:NYN domain-containing protein [Azospira restricta]QRJ63573.1 NYN domain-containing protein [Azospira restricta]